MGFVGLFQFALKCFDVFAWPLFALGYPLCASIQAIETNSKSDSQKLITYWVSFSLILLFECAFEKQLQWLTFWPYIKLMVAGCLLVPHFDGSLYVYKHLVHPCLSMDSRIVVSQFNKLKELLFKKDGFIVEVERYVKGHSRDALENLIAFKKKSAHPDVAAKEIKALATEDSPKFEEPKLPHKKRNAVEIIEQKEVATTKQVRKIDRGIDQAVNRAFAPWEIKETATAAVAGRDIFDILPSEKVQTEWTCAICQVTTQSERVLNSHLQGKSHKAVRELLKTKNRMLKGEASAASVGKKPNIPIAAAGIGVRVHTTNNIPLAWTCVVCRVTVKSQTDIHAHLQGNRHKKAFELLMANNQGSNSMVSHLPAGKESKVPGKESGNCTSSSSISPEIRRWEAMKQCKQENLLERQVVEIKNRNWWCTICNISCTCEGNMDSHLMGTKHLAKTRALRNVGGNFHS